MGTIRAAGLCGLVAFVTFNAGWIAGDLAQPNVAFSPIGGGAATRAGTVVVFLAIAFIGFQLIRKPHRAATPLPVGSDDRRLAEGGTP